MANSYRNDVNGLAACNWIFIADCFCFVDLLTTDIRSAEARTGVRDLVDPAYSVLARSLRVRRDKLQATISSSEGIIGALPMAA
jgi:hypothetical protein